MRSYGKSEAIRRMNELGAAGCPFLFVIDYRQENSFVEELDRVDPAVCRYRLNGQANVDEPVVPSGRPVDWQVTPVSETAYARSFDIVRRHILGGNSYLTNLTCRVPVATTWSLEDIFRYSKALYKLWMKDRFVCFSPEIFVRIQEGVIRSYPMKGTIDATRPDAERLLREDAKEAAEHATIVDLIRNDLSMVADQVRVTRYRYFDRLETNKGPILQTSSEISGVLPADYPAHIGDILFRLLPAGSITGAPKPKTMAIIDAAEGYERGFYTGVMGICDGRNLDSAVMIRFVEQEADGQWCFKAGGGITSQSDRESEYQEVMQKVYVPIC